MKRKITKLLLIILTIVSFSSINVKATTNVIDLTKLGDINITLIDKDDEPVKGVMLSLYHIANISSQEHSLTYEYTNEFKSCLVSLKDIDDKALASKLENCVLDKDATLTKTTDEEGKATFKDLNLGLYLVIQKDKKEGHSTVSSFVLTLPNLVDKVWKYDVDATPKTEIYKVVDINVTKKWITSSNLPKQVVIGLYKDKELIQRAILNKENNWQYTFKDVEKSDNYTVKEIEIPSGYTPTYQKLDNYNFIVTNTKTLAQTGSQAWFVKVLSLTGITLIFLGIIIEKKNRHE